MKKVLGLTMTVIVIFALGCFLYGNFMPQEADDEWTLERTSTKYSLCDIEGNVIESTNSLSVHDHQIEAMMKIMCNKKTSFVFIALADYHQKEITIDSSVHEYYKFTTDSTGSTSFKFELNNLDLKTHEIDLIFFEKPDITRFSISDKLGWNDVYSAQSVMVIRLDVQGRREKENIPFITGKKIPVANSVLSHGAFLSDPSDMYSLLLSSKGGSSAILSLSNCQSYDTNMIIIAFCDWQQVNIITDNILAQAKLAAQSCNEYDITLPKVKNDSPYQILVLENPFGGNLDRAGYFTTARTILKGDITGRNTRIINSIDELLEKLMADK